MADISKLPAPVSQTWQWQMDGSCREHDPSTFFHPEGERGAIRARREARAKQICSGCPVLMQCRRWSLETQETYGIWGGLGEADREVIFARDSRERRGLPLAV